jgi:hypothetical protein|uniref:Uncharacterized protein n=1 Tax=Bathycoccus sp. RCC716 virus 2 TaxID=2530039 RepID=A0A7S6NYK9_9PHYC|nr:hypothetical protein [Bathycoccus sp. RCC716 virus 2]|tara:strand:- start:10332 stop:10586 length:255 start_codon:yes stop_codon:yes gene_type:complete
MIKLNSTNKNTLKAIVIVFAILCALAALRTSKYQPVDIETTNEGSLFDLESKEECLKDSYYSDSRGGVCGGQKLVAAQAGYKMK